MRLELEPLALAPVNLLVDLEPDGRKLEVLVCEPV
jgi:hypothetical protein